MDSMNEVEKKIEEILAEFESEVNVGVAYPEAKKAISSLIQEERQGAVGGKNWYFEGDELVITKGKWVIDRYKKHLKSLEDRKDKE